MASITTAKVSILKCKYCLGPHIRKNCIHLTLEHDADNCMVCQEKNNRFKKKNKKKQINVQKEFKKILWKHIDWDSVFKGNITAPKMFMKSALIRKNLIMKYTSKDNIKTFTINNLNEIKEIINNNNNNNINAWIIKPPEKSNAVGVKAFKNPDVDLGEIYFQKENNNNKKKKNNKKKASTDDKTRLYVLQEYISPLLLNCCNNRKFHIRALVYFVGDLNIYICKEARVLIATKPYSSSHWNDQYIHITNQSVNKKCKLYNIEKQNISLKELIRNKKEQDKKNDNDDGKSINNNNEKNSLYPSIFSQMIILIKELVNNLQENAPRKTFFPLRNTYELFGFDFAVDINHNVKLMEVNPDPSMELFSKSIIGNEQGKKLASINPLSWIKHDDNDDGKKDVEEIIIQQQQQQEDEKNKIQKKKEEAAEMIKNMFLKIF